MPNNVSIINPILNSSLIVRIVKRLNVDTLPFCMTMNVGIKKIMSGIMKINKKLMRYTSVPKRLKVS